MNKKTRGYLPLTVCSMLLVVFGCLYFLSGILALLNISSRSGSDMEVALTMAGLSFVLSLVSFTFALLVQLAIHVADDLYMLRLLKVNEFRASTQKPLPKADD